LVSENWGILSFARCMLLQRLCHMHLHQAPPRTPLYHVFSTPLTSITTTELNLHLCQTCSILRNTLGIAPQDISVRSLRLSGTMALPIADVDTDKIRLLGRWRSDEMLRYLHVQALPILTPLTDLMVHHGFYSLLPSITNRGKGEQQLQLQVTL
jgi:hypothetical protein